jgi:hypothetical protein
MTDPVKEVKDSLEAKLKEGFSGLQVKYDAVADELQKGNTVTVAMKAEIENQKGEIERIIEQVQKLEEKASSCELLAVRRKASSTSLRATRSTRR